MIKVLLAGANGQLGRCIQDVFKKHEDKIQLMATDIHNLDITKKEALEKAFSEFNPEFCINAAAYTAVDKAEEDQETAFLINAKAVGLLSETCKQYQCKFIHVSTDYVYDSFKHRVLDEESPTLPQGIYALSKLHGEIEALDKNDECIILRTSWLYSEYGNNFVKTMLKFGSEGRSLRVINDQFGAPTYAGDLASAIFEIIIKVRKESTLKFNGIFNFSNLDNTTWYHFAVASLQLSGIDPDVTPVPSSEYKTVANRPSNSRMSKEKIIKHFGIKIPEWKDSLKLCIQRLEKQGV